MKVRALRDGEQPGFVVGAGEPADTRSLARGSRRYECSMCSARMWLGPRGQSFVDKGAEPLCSDCFLSSLTGGVPGMEPTAHDEQEAAEFNRIFQNIGQKETQ